MKLALLAVCASILGYNLPTMDPPDNLGPLTFYPDSVKDRLYKCPWDSGVAYTVINPAFNRPSSGHKGYAVDWNMPTGARVLAARAGNVGYLQTGTPGDEGIQIVRNDRDSTGVRPTKDFYLHLRVDTSVARLGRRVEQGQLIGYVGTPNHCHLEVQETNHIGIGVNGRTTEDEPYAIMEDTMHADGIPWSGDVLVSQNKAWVPTAADKGRGVLQYAPTLSAVPNPFISTTRLTLSGASSVRIYAPDGKLAANLQGQKGGFRWDARAMPNGAYVAAVNLNGRTYKKTLVLLK